MESPGNLGLVGVWERRVSGWGRQGTQRPRKPLHKRWPGVTSEAEPWEEVPVRRAPGNVWMDGTESNREDGTQKTVTACVSSSSRMSETQTGGRWRVGGALSL